MGKRVITWTYWLGAVCALLAILARLLDMLGIRAMVLQTRGGSISYHTFLNAALLFLVIAIATMGYERFGSTKS